MGLKGTCRQNLFFVGGGGKYLFKLIGSHGTDFIYFHDHLLTQPMDPEKKSLNFIFPTKYVIPKSLKFSHWLSDFNDHFC